VTHRAHIAQVGAERQRDRALTVELRANRHERAGDRSESLPLPQGRAGQLRRPETQALQALVAAARGVQIALPAGNRRRRQAAAETDQEARKALYDQAAQQIVDDASYVYLYNPEVVAAWSPNVEGFDVRGDAAIRFDDVSLTS
jgi:hypothetical protein